MDRFHTRSPRTSRGVRTRGGRVLPLASVNKRSESPHASRGVRTRGGSGGSSVNRKDVSPHASRGVRTRGGMDGSSVSRRCESPHASGGVRTTGGERGSSISRRVESPRASRRVRFRGGKDGSSVSRVGPTEAVDGRGYSTQGRGRKRTGRRDSIHADDMYLGTVEDMPMGDPLETRLHPKRSRVWSPQPLSTSDIDSNPSPSILTPSLDHLPVKASTLALDGMPPTELYEIIYSDDCPDSPSQPLFLESYESGTQSPAAHLPASPHEALEDDFAGLLNYGSEDSDDDENVADEVLELYRVPLCAGLPRVMRDVWYEEKDECDSEEINIITVAGSPHGNSSPPPTSPDTPSPDNCMKPTDLFDFEWEDFPDPPTDPSTRRESFSDINIGPTCSYASPYDAFTAVWDMQIVQHICDQTNIYAQQHTKHLLLTGKLFPQSRISKWQDLIPDELYVYFAILLAMGIVVKSRINEYWSRGIDIFVTPGFSANMSFGRFRLINMVLHFNNNKHIYESLVTRAKAKLFKIQPVIDHLNRKFSQLYNLSRNIALDESLTQWKGMLQINQFIANKSAEVGIKMYEICESNSGYLWRFEIHTGFEPSQDSGPVSKAIPSIVLRLLQGLENKGHTVWMDNYYNSPALARVLKTRGFDCVGTLRTNRQFVPAELATLQMTRMITGQIYGGTSGDVDVLVWRDKKLVGLISTYHGAAITQCGDDFKPTIVHDYNLCMGGVDRKDQMLAMYPVERKRTKFWYKKIFRRLLNVSVLNSYVMYKHNANIDHRQFRITLIKQLLDTHSVDQVKSIKMDTKFKLVKFSTDVLKHLPEQYSSCPRGSISRRKCTVCKKRTHTYCPGCNLPLCFRIRNNGNVCCFRKYHT